MFLLVSSFGFICFFLFFPLSVFLLSKLAGPIQHFKDAILDAWRNKVAAGLCGRRGFRGGPLLDVHGSLQLHNSSHVRERDKALLRSIMVGGFWNGFLLGRVRHQVVPCLFCGAPDGDGHLFWECTFPPLVEIRENPEFHDLMRMDKGHWPRCLLWHGWLPVLSGVNGALGLLMLLRVHSTWLKLLLVTTLLVLLLSGVSQMVSMQMRLRHGCLMPPRFGSDGSLVLDSVTGVSAAGAGLFARRWGRVDCVQSDRVPHSSRGFVFAGTLLFLTFIGFSLLFLDLWSIMMGGMVLPLILWYGLWVHLPRGVVWFMRFVTGPLCPGPPGLWDGGWVNIPASAICAEDIAHSPYTPGLLVKWVSFLGSLPWPAHGGDLGVGGVSYVELLIFI